MKYSSAKNARWGNPGHTTIDLVVDFNDIGEVPFLASPDDPEQHGVDIYNRAVAGDFGNIAEFEAGNKATQYLRSDRNQLLVETDWWANSDLTMTEDQTAYRKALRDLPATATPELDSEGRLTGVTWPTKP